MLTLIAILVIAILVIIINSQRARPPRYTNGKIDKVPGADEWIETDFSRSDLTNNIFIAGLGHNCSVSDCGIFGGMVFNQKDNPVNKKAMAIGSHQSRKVIGYVPEAILDDYRKWCGRKDCHCVGFIYRDGSILRGRARIYHSDCDNDLIEKDGMQYLEKVCERFGWNIPEGDFKL